MIREVFEISSSIDKKLFESILAKQIHTLRVEYYETDKYHHKYIFETKYPQDFINLGIIIEKLNNK